MFYAHSTSDLTKSDWQELADHLLGAAQLAKSFARPFGGDRAAYLAALLHDLGKYSAAFQERLNGTGIRVDHSTAGAYIVRQLARTGDERLIAETLGYGIAGHHVGLPDMRGGEGGALKDRLDDFAEKDVLDPQWRNEIDPQTEGIFPALNFVKGRAGFQLGFWGRMIFSCLVDADYRDTEAFYASIEDRRVDRDWPRLGERIDSLVGAFDAHMTTLQAKASGGAINDLRSDILAHIRGKAAMPPGLFTLTVPTGGGKTLASLGFALDHAKKYGHERIIYVIPFTSIIDQTAAIFRNVLGEDVLLEHHSAIDEEANRKREARDKLRLAMEDWAAPVVVTTSVQFFESLFAGRPSRCRKLHNIARSIIILDEAQTMPAPLLRPCVAALDELARNYGVSVVLCSATQPALAESSGFDGGLALLPERELAPDPSRLAYVLRRVHIRHEGEMDDETLIEALADEKQGLIILNSRKHALALYRQAKAAGLEGLVHLTTRQYAAHRQRILASVKETLKNEAPCLLIATSLVEAGVDLDFPRVWRAEAGLDQIAQAAGRCNREGARDRERSIVSVFRARDYAPPREIARYAEAFGRMAGEFEDWLSPEAIEAYFQNVYWAKGPELDRHRILERFRFDVTGTDFAYRTVSEKFRMIESGLAPVIVAREAVARKVLDGLAFPEASASKAARALQRFIVQIPPRDRAQLIGDGHVQFEREDRFGDQFAVLRRERLYLEETGLLWEEGEYLGLEQSLF